MAEPLSPDHVSDFLEDDPTLYEEEFEEEPEEELEEEPEGGLVEVTVVSPLTPPTLLESSSDFEVTAPVTADRPVWMPPSGSTFEVGGPLIVSFIY
ncbi:hypothetical protein Tco_1230468 [Tanacetum coccineum]